MVKEVGELKALPLAAELGHEEVVLLHDKDSGLRGAIAIHDSTFGPGVGGTRMRPYASYDDAVVDALRLARAMTYKATMVEMPYGGAKAVIMGDPSRDKTRPLLVAYAKAVDRLGGAILHRLRHGDRASRLEGVAAAHETLVAHR